METYRSSKTFVVITICIAMFTDGFIFGVVVPIYPFLLQSYYAKLPLKNIQMFTSLLTAAFPIADLFTAPICAYYVDRYRNRRVPWCLGLIAMVAGNILFAASNSLALLLLSRLLQGIASAIIYTLGLAIIVESASKDEVGRYMGAAMSCNNFGVIMSPLLGGALFATRGKMSVFGIMAVLIGIDMILRIAMKDTIDPRQSPSLDTIMTPDGKICSSTLELSPQVAAARTSTSSLKRPKHSSICLDTEILWRDSLMVSTIATAQSPSFSRFDGIIKLFRCPRFLAALYGCFINECIVASLCAILPLFVKITFHWTSLEAGCIFLTIAIPGLAGPLAGILSDRFGSRWVSVIGFVSTTPSLMSMMLIQDDNWEQIILLCVLLTLAGCTIVLFLSPLGADLCIVTDDISQELKMDLYASSLSLMNTALAAAGVVGPLFIGWLQEHLGWKATCTAMALLCLSGAVPCSIYTGGRRKPKVEQ